MPSIHEVRRLTLAVMGMMAVAGLVPVALSFSSGAPESACQNMIPQHLVPPQTSPAPYNISVRKKDGSSSVHELTIIGRRPENVIKGFMIQARQNGKPVGKFVLPKGYRLAKYVRCNGVARSAVTHKNIPKAVHNITVSWNQLDVVGKVVFTTTIAENGGIFWVGVETAYPLK